MIAPLLAAPLCLLLAAAPPAPPAPAASTASERLLEPSRAWRGARWGMTVDEVLKAIPGARRLDPATRLADGKVVAAELGPMAQDGFDWRAHFLFEDGRLALVSLKNLPARLAGASDFEAVRARLARETGAPGEERSADATVDYREVRFTSGGTALDVKFLQGALVLLYHPAGP